MKMLLAPQLERLSLLVTLVDLPDFETSTKDRTPEQIKEVIDSIVLIFDGMRDQVPPPKAHPNALPNVVFERIDLSYIKTMAKPLSPPAMEMFGSPSGSENKASYEGARLDYVKDVTGVIQEFVDEELPATSDSKLIKDIKNQLMNKHLWASYAPLADILWPASDQLPYLTRGPVVMLDSMVNKTGPVLTEVRRLDSESIYVGLISFSIQWAVLFDGSGKFNFRQGFELREAIGVWDQVVGFHAAKHHLGRRIFTAQVCQVFMTELRIGVKCNLSAMNLLAADVWTADYALLNTDYVPNGKIDGVPFSAGGQYLAGRTCLKDYRQHILKPTAHKLPKPDTDFAKYVLRTLQRSTDGGEWLRDYKTNAGKDNKNAFLLAERWVALKEFGSSRIWLREPPVWNAVRKRLGAIFAPKGCETYDFADGVQEQVSVGYNSLGAAAASQGYMVAENVHVLEVQSQTLKQELKSDIEKVRQLMIKIGGVPSLGDSLALPGALHGSVVQTMEVS